MVRRSEDKEDDQSFEQRSNFYQWVIGIAVLMVLGLIGVIYGSVNKRIENAEMRMDKKIDREEHYKDMQDIKNYLLEIRKTIHEHEVNSQKRYRGENADSARHG